MSRARGAFWNFYHGKSFLAEVEKHVFENNLVSET
jgi:hypothetical protein